MNDMRERHYRKRTQTTKNKRQTTDKNKNSACTSNIPENLFDILPFRETDTTPEEENKPYVIMTYLPDGIYHQMRRACEKAGVQLITKPGTKLKDLLCAPNKTHHDPSLKPVVYKINCPCTDKATYVGQTIRCSLMTRTHKIVNGKDDSYSWNTKDKFEYKKIIIFRNENGRNWLSIKW